MLMPCFIGRTPRKKPIRAQWYQSGDFSKKQGLPRVHDENRATAMLKYKGYTGHTIFDDEAGIFHGEVDDTRDVITFQGRSVDELETAFRESIDDYLEWCAERGKSPDKPFSGKVVLRMPSPLHRRLAIEASRQGKSLNTVVLEKLEK
jgi:predicted HicB family RNase H-like nuclease